MEKQNEENEEARKGEKGVILVAAIALLPVPTFMTSTVSSGDDT